MADLPPQIVVGGRLLPLEVQRRRGTRTIRLRADAVAGIVRLSLPLRGGTADAARLLASHGDWLAAQVARWPNPLPFVPGQVLPFDGGELTLDWSPQYSRMAQRVGDSLRIGGPQSTLAGRTLRWLKAAALADMAAVTQGLAAQVSRPVAQVRLTDARARWGSCASGGRIAYSWRLILAPPRVRRHVVAHEVAHLVHANHGPDFHALLARLDPHRNEVRRWLAGHGAALHWVGRDA